MKHLNNELIDSPDDRGLLGSRHSDTNDVIISYIMLRYLAPNQLLPVTDHHKMMCGCAICNTSNHLQKTLNAWQCKKLKKVKDKADN